MGARRPNEWPIYELANYDNSGQLVELCKSLLTEHFEPTAAIDDEHKRGKKSACRNGRDKKSNQLETTTTTTSGYQTTLDENKQRAEAETNKRDRRHRPTATRLEDKGERLRQSNKSPQDIGGRHLLWWHLIEPVSYGNLDAGEQVDGAHSERPSHYDEFDGSFRARLARLCCELRRLIGPYLVESHDAFAATRRAVSSLDASKLAMTTTTHAAQLRRLSWRRRAGRIEPSPPPTRTLVRSDTFSARHSEPSDANRARVAAAAKPQRLEKWLATTRGGQRSEWSRAASKRGKYGESLVHLLLIRHTNEHLILLLLVLHLWPALLFDAFESDKFKHLNCLHLTIAQRNTRLLAHLLQLARRCRHGGHFESFVEQRISGSLFRPPDAEKRFGGQAPACQNQFWCDQLEHWPSANGREHLILFDRLMRSHQMSGPSDANQGEQVVYFGQTPLAWSVSFGAKDMFELLVGPAGEAEVLASDELANNCLHQLVINNQPNWTRFLLKFDKRLATSSNHLHLTPFLLACHLGRADLLNELLELSAVEFWTYSSVKCCAYPLESLDSIVVTGKRSGHLQDADQGYRSAVSVILESGRSSDEQKSALLSTGVIKKLLEEKWKIFARRLFYRDLLLTLVQLLLLTIAFYLRPARINLNHLQELEQLGQWASETRPNWLSAGIIKRFLQDHRQQLLRNACELVVALIALSKMLQFLLEWARYRNLSLQFTYNPMVANLVLGNSLVVMCLPVRVIGLFVKVELAVWGAHRANDVQLKRTTSATLDQLDYLEDILLILASPLLWSSLLFFVAAFYVTGPFVAMISYMLMRDLRQFSLIYLIFLYSFAQSIFFINYQQPTGDLGSQPTTTTIGGDSNGTLAVVADPEQNMDCENELTLLTNWLLHLATKYLELWLELFKMTLGVYEFQPYRHSLQSRLLLTLFLHLIPILFNMLIAMMNNTYSQIIAQSERAWSFQWARTLFALERRLNDQEKELYLREYAINLASSIADNATEESGTAEPPFVPGLMIIKRTNCTRAELKRRRLGHWRRATRQILEELKRGRERAPSGVLWTH